MYLVKNNHSWSCWCSKLPKFVFRFNLTKPNYKYQGNFSWFRTFSGKIETEPTRNNGSIEVRSKRPCDSWVSVLFPFKTDIDLRAQYTNMLGDVLIGKLFENFDALAASIGYRHAGA